MYGEIEEAAAFLIECYKLLTKVFNEEVMMCKFAYFAEMFVKMK